MSEPEDEAFALIQSRPERQPVHPEDLLAGDELIPCISCDLECVVEECHPLMDWMYQLAIVGNTSK